MQSEKTLQTTIIVWAGMGVRDTRFEVVGCVSFTFFWLASIFFFAIGLSGFCSAKPSLLININGRRGAEQAYGMPLQWQTRQRLSRWSGKWERKHKHAPVILFNTVALKMPLPHPAFYFELWRLVAFLVFRKHHKRETYDVALLVAIIDSAFPSLVCFVQNGDTNEISSCEIVAIVRFKHTNTHMLHSSAHSASFHPLFRLGRKRCGENRQKECSVRKQAPSTWCSIQMATEDKGNKPRNNDKQNRLQ